MSEDNTTRVRIWDLPTRAFHWALAVCIVASIISARIGGNAMAWHFRFGYAVFALLLFRLGWGWVGGHWSRFRTFVYAPSAVTRYLRGRSLPHEHHEVGHSPLAAFSVFALLGVLAAQVGTGLFADDEIAYTGPLVRLVSGATSSSLTGWHKGYGQWAVIGLAVLHVMAVAYYLLVRRKNLVRPMWSGDKELGAPAPAAIDNVRTRLMAAALFGLCAGLVGWLVTSAG